MSDTDDQEPTPEPTPVATPPYEESPSATGVVAEEDPDELAEEDR